MGTTYIISTVKYCDPGSDPGNRSADPILNGAYGKLDGYPTGIGRDLLNGKLSFPNFRCEHTPEQIAAGIHDRGRINYSAAWHYWQDGGKWMAEHMDSGEIHSLRGWLFGNKGRPLAGANGGWPNIPVELSV